MENFFGRLDAKFSVGQSVGRKYAVKMVIEHSSSPSFWAAAPRGRYPAIPVRHRDEFPDIRPYIRTPRPLTPQSGFHKPKSALSGSKSALSVLYSSLTAQVANILCAREPLKAIKSFVKSSFKALDRLSKASYYILLGGCPAFTPLL